MAKRKDSKRVKSKQEPTEQQKAFAREYLRTGNGAASYRAAGYKAKTDDVAATCASKLLRSAKVAQFLAGLSGAVEAERASSVADERTVASVARLELELERLALYDPRKLYDAAGNLKPPHEWDDDTAAAVQSVEALEQGDKGTLKKVKGHPKAGPIIDLLKRRDRAANPPAPTPGSSPETPLHVSVTQRIADLEATFLAAAERAGQGAVPGDDP